MHSHFVGFVMSWLKSYLVLRDHCKKNTEKNDGCEMLSWLYVDNVVFFCPIFVISLAMRSVIKKAQSP